MPVTVVDDFYADPALPGEFGADMLAHACHLQSPALRSLLTTSTGQVGPDLFELGLPIASHSVYMHYIVYSNTA